MTTKTNAAIAIAATMVAIAGPNLAEAVVQTAPTIGITIEYDRFKDTTTVDLPDSKLQDDTGRAVGLTFHLHALFRGEAPTKPPIIVLMKVEADNKDFGAGYFYQLDLIVDGRPLPLRQVFDRGPANNSYIQYEASLDNLTQLNAGKRIEGRVAPRLGSADNKFLFTFTAEQREAFKAFTSRISPK